MATETIKTLPYGITLEIKPEEKTRVYTLHSGIVVTMHTRASGLDRLYVNIDDYSKVVRPLAVAIEVFREVLIPYEPKATSISISRTHKQGSSAHDRSYKYETRLDNQYLVVDKWERNEKDKAYRPDGSSISWAEFGKLMDIARAEADIAYKAKRAREAQEFEEARDARVKFVEEADALTLRALVLRHLEGGSVNAPMENLIDERLKEASPE